MSKQPEALRLADALVQEHLHTIALDKDAADAMLKAREAK